jgi:hypothetical protein
MSTSCCIGYLKPTNLQNVHHEPQCIVDNDVQQNGIILALLLVDSSTRNLNFLPQVLQSSWFSGVHAVLYITPQVKVNVKCSVTVLYYL